MSYQFAALRNALRAVYGHAWDRTNPYEGPEICACGHLYDDHWGDPPSACSRRDCECEGFEAGASDAD